MARVIGPTPGDRWEREVMNQLRAQLPSDWLVLAGVTWSRQGPSDNWRYVRDGQADFVVLAPSLGMVIVEVKGSREFRIGDDGRWYRRDLARQADVEILEPPPAQAIRNMHELVDVVLRKGTWLKFPGLYAYVVIYPQGRLATASPALYDASTLITQPQMHELEGRLRRALNARGAAAAGQQFEAAVLREVARILTSRPFEITKVDTPLEARDDASGIEVLTRQQFAALQGVFRHPRVAVLGPAGSGKTVLALWRLQALAEEGRRGLYLCFNKDLAAVLRQRQPELSANIVSVDRFFVQVAKAASRLPPPSQIEQDPTQFFRQELPWIVIDAISDWSPAQRYDAVIVDEGQDFSEDQLLAAIELLKQDVGTYVFFADWKQDIFRQATAGPVGADVVFTLHHNCRNTQRINARTNKLLDSGVASMPGVPEGVDPMVQHCSDKAAMSTRAWQIARDWAAAGGAVAILSPYILENSCMAAARKGYGLQLADSIDHFGSPGTVFFSTIKSFKGIEAASVIVVDADLPRENSPFRAEDLYVACTRATARLALLAYRREAADWLEGNETQFVPSSHAR
jgi:thymidine kinase